MESVSALVAPEPARVLGIDDQPNVALPVNVPARTEPSTLPAITATFFNGEMESVPPMVAPEPTRVFGIDDQPNVALPVNVLRTEPSTYASLRDLTAVESTMVLD
jgi:hypothetical protein